MKGSFTFKHTYFPSPSREAPRPLEPSSASTRRSVGRFRAVESWPASRGEATQNRKIDSQGSSYPCVLMCTTPIILARRRGGASYSMFSVESQEEHTKRGKATGYLTHPTAWYQGLILHI